MRALVFLFFGFVSAASAAEMRDFSAPLLADRPIVYSLGVGSNWYNQWAADGFCAKKGFKDGAESFEPAGYLYGYRGEVNIITKGWSNDYSVEKVMASKTELFARITCR